MALVHGRILTFSMVFPEERKMDMGMYLYGLNKKDMLRIAASLISVNQNAVSDESNRDFLLRWMNGSNVEFFDNLVTKIEALESSSSIPIFIFNPISSLKIFEHAISNLEDRRVSNDGSLEIRLIKAYLILNEQLDDLEKICIGSLGAFDKQMKYAWYLFCYNHFSYEFIHYFLSEYIIVQLVKSVYVFDFLSSRSEVKWLLDAFLQDNGQTDWKSYLKEYLPITNSLLRRPKGKYLEIAVSQGEKFALGCRFLDNFTVDNEEALDERDFKSLRAKPLCKLEEGKYLVVYDLFAVEKIFIGAYVKLLEIYDYSDESLRTLGPFKAFYGREFSENYLLYRTISDCFSEGYIHIPGVESKKRGMTSREPDYYIRDEDKIFLFENKDTLIEPSIKQSCDYNEIEPELKKRFYFSEKEGKIKNGAVLQLMHNIKLIRTSKFIPDKEAEEDATIYPILIVHYNQFNAPGLNRIVNEWFQIEINKIKEEGINVENIFPLTIIDIDTLILLQDYLKSRQIVLEDVIQQYGENMKHPYENRPFSNLIMSLAISKRFIKSPAILEECGLRLFE